MTETSTDTPLITAEELAGKLGVSVKTVWKLTRERRIPYHRVGRHARYDYAEVREATAKRPRRYISHSTLEVGRRLYVATLYAAQQANGWHLSLSENVTDQKSQARYLSDALKQLVKARKRSKPEEQVLRETMADFRQLVGPISKQESLLKLKRTRRPVQ